MRPNGATPASPAKALRRAPDHGLAHHDQRVSEVRCRPGNALALARVQVAGCGSQGGDSLRPTRRPRRPAGVPPDPAAGADRASGHRACRGQARRQGRGLLEQLRIRQGATSDDRQGPSGRSSPPSAATPQRGHGHHRAPLRRYHGWSSRQSSGSARRAPR